MSDAYIGETKVATASTVDHAGNPINRDPETATGIDSIPTPEEAARFRREREAEELEELETKDVEAEKVARTTKKETTKEAKDAKVAPVLVDPEKSAADIVKYNPNYKFKVQDKEHEIPEYLRGSVTDADKEKQLREVFEKAHGLDLVKPKHEKLKQDFEALGKNYTQLSQPILKAIQAYNRGDVEEFFKHTGIDEKIVLNWVADRINYNEASPEERARMDREKQTQRSAHHAEEIGYQKESELSQERTSRMGLELKVSLMDPRVKTFADEFDTNPRKPCEDFRTAVLDEGELEWLKSGKKTVLPFDECVSRAMKRYAGYVGEAAPNQNPTTSQTTSARKLAPKVIPNVAGGEGSPIARGVTSLDDIKRIRQEKYGN